jgi:hypothetical protein
LVKEKRRLFENLTGLNQQLAKATEWSRSCALTQKFTEDCKLTSCEIDKIKLGKVID